MKSTTRLFVLLLAFAVVPVLSGCDSTDPLTEEEPPLETVRVEDLAAGGAIDTTGGQPEPVEGFTFYSLRENRVVEDSASAEWDIAFQGTTILVNGGTSGPGQGVGYVVETPLSGVKRVDVDRLVVDDAEAGVFAVPPGSESGWYIYNANGQHYVRPIPGRTIVIRTADGEHYAKIKILSYYKGAPELPTDREKHPGRYYTFEYVIQTDGSTF